MSTPDRFDYVANALLRHAPTDSAAGTLVTFAFEGLQSDLAAGLRSAYDVGEDAGRSQVALGWLAVSDLAHLLGIVNAHDFDEACEHARLLRKGSHGRWW